MIRIAVLIITVSLLLTGCVSSRTSEDNAKALDINVRLGLAYIKQQRYKLAELKLKRALEAGPESSRAHWAYALMEEGLERYESAEKYYREAIRLNNRDAEALNNYGAFLCKRGRPFEGIASFDKAISSRGYSNRHIAQTNAGICMVRAGDVNKAEEYFRTALKGNAVYGPALYQMALLMQSQRRYLQARAYRQRLKAALNREDPKVLLLCVQTERAMSNHDLANECEAQLKSRFPASEEAASLY